MGSSRKPDWDPQSDGVQRDQIAAYDEMRRRCPVAFSDFMQWSLFRHEDVQQVLADPETFSNAAGRHRSVPNSMDPPEHTLFRAVIDPYFAPGPMRDFEPHCRRTAVGVIERLPVTGEFDAQTDLGQVFALEVQCAFLGWPSRLHGPLMDWTRHQHQAVLAGDQTALGELGLQFDGLIRQQLHSRREAGEQAPDDVTTRLMRETVEGRALRDEEIVSILRNWTVGELGTIAASVGILVRYLAEKTELQELLRGEPRRLSAAIDEILRLDPPLISNRRITRRPVEIGGRHLAAGERLTILWASANRDEAVFGDPDALHFDRPAGDNLLYGAGIHACPGAPLARLELRLLLEELLARTRQLAPLPDRPAVRARYPAGGYSSIPLSVRRHDP